MSDIFLSASVPLPDRHPRFRETVDVTAIKDAVRSLAIACSGKHTLVFGGHPAITPLIRQQMEDMGSNVSEGFIIYQSLFFERQFIPDLEKFERIVYTQQVEDSLEKSLLHMRQEMLSSRKFDAAFFIGGMEGILVEYVLFHDKWPSAKIFPIASTGAGARILFNERVQEMGWGDNLLHDMRYLSLFKQLLKSI